MASTTGSSGAENSPKLDSLTLWLNYENKMDELRSRFLTIATLLFTLQSAIFALILDKIFLVEKALPKGPKATILLIILSTLTFFFFIFIFSTYFHHIKTNFLRSTFVVYEYDRDKRGNIQ